MDERGTIDKILEDWRWDAKHNNEEKNECAKCCEVIDLWVSRNTANSERDSSWGKHDSLIRLSPYLCSMRLGTTHSCRWRKRHTRRL
jgi:hypothetical protein